MFEYIQQVNPQTRCTMASIAINRHETTGVMSILSTPGLVKVSGKSHASRWTGVAKVMLGQLQRGLEQLQDHI